MPKMHKGGTGSHMASVDAKHSHGGASMVPQKVHTVSMKRMPGGKAGK